MHLSTLKSKPLQHIAFLTGHQSAGTKSQIADRLNASLQQSRLPRNGNRILSVDMGIRNLAYCVIDVPSESKSTSTALHLHSWKRLDLLGRLKSHNPTSRGGDTEAAISPSDANAVFKDAFTPSIMSKAALSVAQDLLKYKPDTILIERQRFRSGGGSAIQEWTVRVNTLESMLWACFETLRSSRAQKSGKEFPTVYEASPKRVASFWTAPQGCHLPSADLLSEGYKPPDTRLAAVKGKAAATGKKEKISVLRSWLDGTGEVSLSFSPETEATATAFAPGVGGRKTKKNVDAVADDARRETKLDDLADCVLQGAAWVRWEENRRAIVNAVSERTV